MSSAACCSPCLQKVGSSGRVIGLEAFPDAAQAARNNVESHMEWCNKEQAHKVSKALEIVPTVTCLTD